MEDAAKQGGGARFPRASQAVRDVQTWRSLSRGRTRAERQVLALPPSIGAFILQRHLVVTSSTTASHQQALHWALGCLVPAPSAAGGQGRRSVDTPPPELLCHLNATRLGWGSLRMGSSEPQNVDNEVGTEARESWF